MTQKLFDELMALNNPKLKRALEKYANLYKALPVTTFIAKIAKVVKNFDSEEREQIETILAYAQKEHEEAKVERTCELLSAKEIYEYTS